MSLLELFIDVDDFYQGFELWASSQQLSEASRRGPAPSLSPSEIMTIVIHFHQAGYRDFKHYYQQHVCEHLIAEFPRLVSYGRFVELMPGVLLVLCACLQSRFGSCTGIAFVDSTPLAVCHNRRIKRHRVFKDLAARGKTTMGTVRLTPGNVDDRKPLAAMSEDLFGKLFGDKGYLSQPLFEKLFERGLELVTTLRKNYEGSTHAAV